MLGSMFPSLNGLAVQRNRKKLLDQMRDMLRAKHYSLRTEQSYCDWVERFIRFDSFAPRSLSLSACRSMS
jgi:Phage integrase, N-terminal SAM-like domain